MFPVVPPKNNACDLERRNDFRQSEFGSSFYGANMRGLYVGISMSARNTKMAEDRESSLDTRLPKYATFSVPRSLTSTRKKQSNK